MSGKRFILDGALILPIGGVLSFDALQARLHPAASRIARLSRETSGVRAAGMTARKPPWTPLDSALVVEVLYDQVTGGCFRDGTRLSRWRPDKAPRQCTFDQLQSDAAPSVVAAIVQASG